jgi:hypothetical protein
MTVCRGSGGSGWLRLSSRPANQEFACDTRSTARVLQKGRPAGRGEGRANYNTGATVHTAGFPGGKDLIRPGGPEARAARCTRRRKPATADPALSWAVPDHPMSETHTPAVSPAPDLTAYVACERPDAARITENWAVPATRGGRAILARTLPKESGPPNGRVWPISRFTEECHARSDREAR